MKLAYYLFLPVLCIGLALYSLAYYPAQLQLYGQQILYVPYAVGVIALVLGFRFNKSRIFFLVILLLLTYAAYMWGTREPARLIDVLLLVVPTAMMLLSLLPERGIFRLRAIDKYVILLGSVALVLTALFYGAAQLQRITATEILAGQYLAWTTIHQPGLALILSCFVLALSRYLAWPAMDKAAYLGMLPAFAVSMHLSADALAVAWIFSFIMIMLIISVVQDSYRMAYMDELTELPARRALRELFQKIRGTYAVAMVDVDHFKKFNDTYGHDVGDNVLRMVGAKLLKATGGGKAFRYGGEEFTLVFQGKSSEQVRGYLDELRETIAGSRFVIRNLNRRKHDSGRGRGRKAHTRTECITVSIGVADSTIKCASPWDVMKAADKALYKAKKSGRNCVRAVTSS